MTAQEEPIWVDPRLVEVIHERQLSEHGGSRGIRDRGGLESALARPRQLQACGGKEIDLPALAAAYAFGIARNHPYVDGNKRTAYVVCRTFLLINGWDIVGPLSERYPIFLGLAAGEIDEPQLTDWIRSHARPEGINEPSTEYEPS